MSYKKDTIVGVIKKIDQRKMYLPALQRKFVWNKPQIELLFDSLMRNYPIGTFLFWRLSKQKAESYVFYEFLTEYHEDHPYNRRKTGSFSHDEIIGVLDGQQRLSSMYIGLMGTHTEKAYRKRRSSPDAFEKTSLYLNLLSLPYIVDEEDKVQSQEDKNFEFRFMTKERAETALDRVDNKPRYWMHVGEALRWNDDPEFDQIFEEKIVNQCKNQLQKEAVKHQRRYILKALRTLHDRLHRDELINYFEIAKDELEDILQIFVRVNSGGTTLTKTDLLFSTIVATWDDGREEIEEVLKTINDKGDGFNFSNEYLMRCCLVLSDGPVLYKVNSFKSENVQTIKDEWPQIKSAVLQTVDLLVELGFNGKTLTSQNATLIIAYYLYKGGDRNEDSKRGIQKYLVHALLKGIYGSAQEQLISTLRDAFRVETQSESTNKVYKGAFRSFSFEEMLKIDLPNRKTLAVTEEDIELFLELSKGPAFSVLSLLYPNLRFSEVEFHQDHIHPAAGFNRQNYEAMGIPESQWKEWEDRRDLVPNLQLMEGRKNQSKNAKPLQEWLSSMDKSKTERFAKDNYFPEGVKLDFRDFMDFYSQRKKILREELRKVLAVTRRPVALEEGVDWTAGESETANS